MQTVELTTDAVCQSTNSLFADVVMYSKGVLQDTEFQLFEVSLAYTHHFIVAPIVEFTSFVTLLQQSAYGVSHIPEVKATQVSFTNSIVSNEHPASEQLVLHSPISQAEHTPPLFLSIYFLLQQHNRFSHYLRQNTLRYPH